uniref:Si:ch211-168f7.5 n=1 Tax=Hippocampus comes TaxID=109280 RepID=A0A3Q2XKW3_HIPCM
MAAGRRGYVNSLWSGTDRVRIGERLKATLAGVLELELLRCKHLEMVDAALGDRADVNEPEPADGSEAQDDAGQNTASSRGQQVSPPTLSAPNTNLQVCINSRWSTLSWDAPSDLLSPPTPEPSGAIHLDSDSRPSSGFYSVSGSSLSDSCYSVSSDAAQGGQVQASRPSKVWEQVPGSVGNTDILWLDFSRDPEVSGLSFLSDLCPGLNHSLISSLLKLDRVSLSSTSSCAQRPQLDSCYCEDLISRRTKEVYPYPSPLHAVALQSPLFTCQTQARSPSPNPEGNQADEQTETISGVNPPLQRQNVINPASLTQLEQYIARLAHQYHRRINLSIPDLAQCPVTHRGLGTSGKSHGSTQSLSAFESRSTPSTLPGGSVTPCKSLLGNSARVSLNAPGKKATRNSINLGSLPSATGEDLNINVHLNLNLNLAPGLNSNRGIVEAPQKVNLGADSAGSAASVQTQPSSTPGPALRARPRISTCPTSLNHRSSLEITSVPAATSGFGPPAFSRSLDWSAGASSPRPIEDSPMVGEISRLSGLSRAVVVGLMEQGVELDIDCFQAEAASELKKHKGLLVPHKEQAHDYIRPADLNPQRPIQLSLSVTHSPQSQSSLTPPLSHSSSPILPYQSIHAPSSITSPSNLAHSPLRPLQPSPMGATPLSVFRRDAPFQCSLPRATTSTSPAEYGGIHPRSGSLRHSGGWNRVEGDGLYRGKHASHKLIRAATVSSYSKREDYGSAWLEDEETRSRSKTSNKLSRAFEGHLWGKDTGEQRRAKVESSAHDKLPKGDSSPIFLKKRGKEGAEKRSSSVRMSRRALFRSESQGLLVPCNQDEPTRQSNWVSSFDVGQCAMSAARDEGAAMLRAKDNHLSSTASLFNLSCSQSFESSCHSHSPLSSPSFSPSPPPRLPLQRTRSLRDLGRRVFGSMRSLSLKQKPSKK